MMEESILNGKKILVVDDEPDILDVIEEEILATCPKAMIDKVSTYERGAEFLKSKNYDVVILDIMGVRGFDLLDLAVSRNFPVAMLTAHALSPEALKKSIEMGARAYLPKEKLSDIVSFLEDVLKESDFLSGWKRLTKRLEAYFNTHWGEYWQRKEEKFWKDFDQKTSSIKW